MKVVMNNSILQMPLNFHYSKKPVEFSVHKKGLKITLDKRGKDYCGHYVETKDGGKFYAVGSKQYEHLPSKLDFNILFGIVALCLKDVKVKTKLKYKSIYSLLKDLGLQNSQYYQQKLQCSLSLWHDMSLFFEGRILFYEECNITNKKRILKRLFLPSIIDFNLATFDDGNEIEISLSDKFLNLISNYSGFYSTINYDDLRKLKSDIGTRLFCFLASIEKALLKKPYIKNLKSFYTDELGMTSKSKTSRIINEIKKALEEVNKISKNKYCIEIFGNNVQFKLE